MNCNDNRKLLTAYILNDLDECTEERVRNHLKTCEHCRAESWEVHTTLALLHDALAVPTHTPTHLSGEKHDQLLGRFSGWGRKIDWLVTGRHRAIAMAAAAMFMIAVVMTIVVPSTLKCRESYALPRGSGIRMEESMEKDSRSAADSRWRNGSGDKSSSGWGVFGGKTASEGAELGFMAFGDDFGGATEDVDFETDEGGFTYRGRGQVARLAKRLKSETAMDPFGGEQEPFDGEKEINVKPVDNFSPEPAEFDSVAMVKSPVIFKGVYGARSPSKRREALAREKKNDVADDDSKAVAPATPAPPKMADTSRRRPRQIAVRSLGGSVGDRIVKESAPVPVGEDGGEVVVRNLLSLGSATETTVNFYAQNIPVDSDMDGMDDYIDESFNGSAGLGGGGGGGSYANGKKSADSPKGKPLGDYWYKAVPEERERSNETAKKRVVKQKKGHRFGFGVAASEAAAGTKGFSGNRDVAWSAEALTVSGAVLYTDMGLEQRATEAQVQSGPVGGVNAEQYRKDQVVDGRRLINSLDGSLVSATEIAVPGYRSEANGPAKLSLSASVVKAEDRPAIIFSLPDVDKREVDELLEEVTQVTYSRASSAKAEKEGKGGEGGAASKDYNGVIKLAESADKVYPDSTLVPEVLWEKSSAQYELGDGKKARNTAAKIVKQYPKSSVSSKAHDLIKRIETEERKKSEEHEKGPRFKAVGVNPFYAVTDKAFSTFAIDVDTASYTLTRNYISKGLLPMAESVRTEEVVNFFDYAYKAPTRETFRVYAEAAPSKFGHGLDLLKIGVKGRRLGREEQRQAVLTFLIDSSGSMDQSDRIGLIRKSLTMLAGKLSPDDLVAIVQYDSRARVILEHTPVSKLKEILAAVDGMRCGGSTNLEEGMRKAYGLAASSFVSKGENRVLLMSDGVANLGTTGAEDILKTVEKYKKQGIYCSVFGFGIGTYDDDMLETLANKGDGTYRFIDSEREARRVFVDDLAATLNTIGADVKIQVEFNSETVKKYRQLGYENRQLTKQQFRDNTVDAGEVGSGQSVTALYELERAQESGVRGQVSDEEPILATVRVRYRRTDNEQIEEIEHEVKVSDIVRSFDDDTDSRFKLAACAAEFAELLRACPYAAGGSFSDVADVLAPVAMDLELDKNVQELLWMVNAGRGMARATE